MTVTYTPKVAAARERLDEEPMLDFQVVDAAALRLLLADHARLAEEAAKLRRVVEAAKGYRPYVPDVEPKGAAKYSDMNCKAHALLTALADLEKENEAAK